MQIKNKVVLVTGSSQGIGKETAIAFAEKGANVIITYNSNKKKGEEVLKECKKLNNSLLLHLDVTNTDSVRNCIEKIVNKFGAIDILVNNAGVLSDNELIKQSVNEVDLQIDTNLKGLIRMTKAILPFIKEQDESIIINIASAAGKQAYADLSVYCATKFAVRGFTQAMSRELPKNVKIYSINPGLTATAMTGFQGINPKKVADIIIRTAEEKIKPDNLGDIDIWKFA